MADDVPSRMLYAGRRWRVTDVPTRLTSRVWELPIEGHRHMFGWRFQATDDEGESFVFDLYRAEHDWHVHRAYA